MKRPVLAAAVVLAVLLAVAGGSAAFAYFSASGSSSGSATTSTGPVLSLAAGTPTAALYPGGTSSVWVTISNPSDSAVHVNSLTVDASHGAGGFAVDSGHSGCSTQSLSFAPQSTGWTIPAQGSLAVQTASTALAMALTADNACQGATFTVFLKVG